MLECLNNIARITMGQSPKSSAYNSAKIGLPFLQGRTTFGAKYPYYDTWTSEWNRIAEPNDILFTVRAPVGDINIALEKTAIGRGVAAIHPIKITTEYLFYLLTANKNKFLTSSTGTIYDSINKDALESIKLFVHNQPEQLYIVDIIPTLFHFVISS